MWRRLVETAHPGFYYPKGTYPKLLHEWSAPRVGAFAVTCPMPHARVSMPTPQVLEASYMWLTARDASLPPALWAAAADRGRTAALAAAAAAAVRRLRSAGEAWKLLGS